MTKKDKTKRHYRAHVRTRGSVWAASATRSRVCAQAQGPFVCAHQHPHPIALSLTSTKETSFA